MIEAFEDNIWTGKSDCIMRNFTVLLLSSRQQCRLHKVIPSRAMKTWRRGALTVAILKIGIRGGEESATRPDRFTVVERAPCTHRIGGWVDLRAGLEALMKGKSLAPAGNRMPLHRTSSL
jgi:hypothetical protein